ncbi:MAG: multidrug ABC transporter substrate-binding protein [Verrucomicrobia bacterium RIFCSPLOWO2_12_FULL_64_8]|nr:MAG: multidrug ABC transporter substrate-binding protein [Verrucomicrobia bacterium RIFCSPLOWO2_12_FULL_64_8]
MRFLSTIKVALRALRRNTMRSMLTALGIIIGVGAVITMVSIGSGARAQVEAQIASLGQNIITVFPGSFSAGGMRSGWGGSATLTPEDGDAIVREVANVVGLSIELRDRTQVLANGLNWNTEVKGESPDYPFIRSWPIASGGMFEEQDVNNIGKVAVIGQTVVDQLFPDVDPIGQTLRIRNLPFRVIGVLGRKGYSVSGQDQDDVVIIPYTSHMRRLSHRPYINAILVQAAKPGAVEQVQQDINDLLTQRRQGREPDFTVRNQQEIAEFATAQSRTMTMLLAGIACVSLVVGGIGIMNIMLVSVTERTREIGIRLAVGAHGSDVLAQFLIEAVILSSMGGILGILLGIGASESVSWYYKWPVLVPTFWIVVAVTFSAAVGVFFGYYPARKASQLDPIDALRYE